MESPQTRRYGFAIVTLLQRGRRPKAKGGICPSAKHVTLGVHNQPTASKQMVVIALSRNSNLNVTTVKPAKNCCDHGGERGYWFAILAQWICDASDLIQHAIVVAWLPTKPFVFPYLVHDWCKR